MTWTVLFHPKFKSEWRVLGGGVKEKFAEIAVALETLGPKLGRPLVDTLKGSRHSNMKEIRFSEGGGVWRFAFAFDPERNAVILIGADKRGRDQNRFYKQFLREADLRFDDWLAGKGQEK